MKIEITKNKLIILFIISFFLVFLLIDKYILVEKNYIIKQYNKNLKKQYESIVYLKNKSVDSIIESIKNSNDGKIINLFDKASKTKNKKELKKIRDEVYHFLKERYKMMQRNRGVLQFHFTFSNNITFLRMHKPSKYGDDLSNVRKDVVEANKNKIIIRGLSTGKTSHAIRNIYPIYNKNSEYLGLIEISYPSELFQNILTNIDGLHSHFLIDKKVFNTNLWKREDVELKYYQSAENKDFFTTFNKIHRQKPCINLNNQKLKKYKDLISLKMKENKIFGIDIYFENKYNILSFYPLKDNIKSDKVLAWIVAYSTSKEIEILNKNKKILIIVSSILLLVIFLFIYFIVTQKENLKILVEKKTKELNKLNVDLENKVQERTNQLNSKNIQLLNVLNSSELGYWEWSLDTNYLEVNDRWLEIIGLDRKDFKNHTNDWASRVHKDDLLTTYEIINNNFKQNLSFTVEFRMKHTNGKYIWIESSGSAVDFDNDGKPIKAYGIHKDIQKRKENIDRLKQQDKIIQNQVKVNAISNMLENIAHQWRQPLSIISTSVSGIKLMQDFGETISKEKLDDCSTIVLKNTKYLSKTIDDFINLFNTKNDDTQRLKIDKLFQKLIKANNENFELESIKCILNIKNSIELNINPNIFIHSLLNIVNNSLDAFNDNNIPKEERFIFIDSKVEKDTIIIKIKDNAGGVMEDIKHKIFEPYSTTKHQSIGTGLSLYMTYQVITKQLNGTIQVDNTEYLYNNKKYKGAIFTIKI